MDDLDDSEFSEMVHQIEIKAIQASRTGLPTYLLTD